MFLGYFSFGILLKREEPSMGDLDANTGIGANGGVFRQEACPVARRDPKLKRMEIVIGTLERDLSTHPHFLPNLEHQDSLPLPPWMECRWFRLRKSRPRSCRPWSCGRFLEVARGSAELESCPTARGDSINMPCAASPPKTFCQEKVVTSSLSQGSSIAKAADVASQYRDPFAFGRNPVAVRDLYARCRAVPQESVWRIMCSPHFRQLTVSRFVHVSHQL